MENDQAEFASFQIGEVLKALNQLPTQLRTECSRLSVGFLYYDETGDSPSGWSCLTGCRILDAALKQRSGECPPTGGPAIHRLPGLMGENVEDSPGKTSSRSHLLPPIPTVRILEAKSPPSFLLSWERGLRMLNNLSEPIVYVLQVKTYFGPEFDNRLSSAWKTLAMSTLTGAQLSEPGIGWWYQFQVAAVNRWGSRGFELPTPPVQLTSHKPRPSPPPRGLSDGILTLHANGEIRVEIHWAPPALTSIPVTEYRIYWGPDAAKSPQESGFSEKPTQFVQTVPAVLAMSSWGAVQLRSEPSQIFLKTPPISHVQQQQQQQQQQQPASEFSAREDEPKWYPDSRDGDRSHSNPEIFSSNLSDNNKNEDPNIPDHVMACICEGTSKSEILPLMMSRDQENINGGTRLQMHTDPAIYDGSDLRVRLELTKPFQQADLSTRSAMTNTEHLPLQHQSKQNLQFIVRWTPQVCIETQTSIQKRDMIIKPADLEEESTDSASRRPANGESQFMALMKMASDAFGTQSGLISLNSVRRSQSNDSTLLYGEMQLTRLQPNCRYLIRVYNVASTTQSDVNSDRGKSRVQLAACLCTPTCTKIKLAPWVRPLSCYTQEKRTLPEPQKLTHLLVRTTPLSYNITWLPSLSGAKDLPRPHTNGSKQTDDIEGSKGHRTADQSSASDFNSINPMHDVHYRIVWGPSRDKPIGSALWKMWPGLRPRLDPGLAETKVLRNGETSIVLSALAPETQYVVKVQAITRTDAQPSDRAASVDHLPTNRAINRMTMRSSTTTTTTTSGSNSDGGGGRGDDQMFLTSKEVFLYFKTPRIAQSYKPGSSVERADEVMYRSVGSGITNPNSREFYSQTDFAGMMNR
ncbi:hypothetical protein FBUS_01510 [Fasciolopsis buskii]|uniref:Fibronectin type-III domain-containing protein n=1 Tax=Fasciolopsis buskii TaxID=27845 RepID=A0A8E0RS25_9TREM|nr:hypothetical protein FBUS_01510 [Fasciolopsis buski]